VHSPVTLVTFADFAEQSHKGYEQHDHTKASPLKPLIRPEKLLERPLARSNMVDNNNQNALYVVESSGKLNLVDAQNRMFLDKGKIVNYEASSCRPISTQQSQSRDTKGS